MDISPLRAALFSGLRPNKDEALPTPAEKVTPAPATPTPDTNGTLQAASSTSPGPDKDGGEASAIDRIRAVGFRAYAEEVKKEKMEELRRDILREMGLSEEDLAKMPPEQRDAIEKMIAQEIARRLAALNEADDKPKGLMPGIPASLIAAEGGAESALGVLLALQERTAPDGQPLHPTDDKDDDA